MTQFANHVMRRDKRAAQATPQTVPVPGREQEMTKTHAGGHAFLVDDFTRTARFCVLGTEKGTYYQGERDLTKQSFASITNAIKADGARVVQMVTDISVAGRAPKNDYALFVLALCAAADDAATRQAAYAALPQVARIGTDLFHFAQFVSGQRGWGRGLRRAMGDWYLTKTPKNVAFQVTKYPSRDGWSHKDVLALSHAHARATGNPEMEMVLRYATWGWKGLQEAGAKKAVKRALKGEVAEFLGTIEELKTMTPEEAASTIADLKLAREVVPTELLNHPVVWDALLQHMPLGALTRNLGNLSKHGLTAPMSAGLKLVQAALGDAERIRKSRLHPVALLKALLTYRTGRSLKGSGTWPVASQVVDALDAAFYLAFGNVPKTEGDLLGIDISGSMFGTNVLGIDNLTAAEAAAAMALVTANASGSYFLLGYHERPVPLDGLSPTMRLDQAVKYMQRHSVGVWTDCSLPMRFAAENNIPVKTFVIYTDNETGSAGGYYGYGSTFAGLYGAGGRSLGSTRGVRPFQALKMYRERTGLPAKLVVVGMTMTDFSVADPTDAGSMDVVGFGTAAPSLIAAFANGEF